MIYCDLIKAEKDQAKYKIGQTLSDITGVIVFKTSGEYEILEQPQGGRISPLFVRKIIGKYAKDIMAGVFKEKLSYEAF